MADKKTLPVITLTYFSKACASNISEIFTRPVSRPGSLWTDDPAEAPAPRWPGRAMTVQAILNAKGNDVVTIAPSAELASAVKLLADHRIGALIVDGGDRPVAGIISERDVIRVMAELGAAALTLSVGQVMTRKVVTCTRAEIMSSVMELMTAGKFRHLPVVEDDRLFGIISIGDVVKYRLHQIESESAALRDYIRSG